MRMDGCILALMRPDGYFKITGRARDMIIRGGENVYPREIEEFLYTHPAIAAAQVIGIPDERLGEVAAAFVIPRPGVQLSADDVVEWAHAHIANFKVPRRVEVVDELPLNATGKVDKNKLRQTVQAYSSSGQ